MLQKAEPSIKVRKSVLCVFSSFVSSLPQELEHETSFGGLDDLCRLRCTVVDTSGAVRQESAPKCRLPRYGRSAAISGLLRMSSQNYQCGLSFRHCREGSVPWALNVMNHQASFLSSWPSI